MFSILKRSVRNGSKSNGFTLVELVVSIGIFVLMTSLLMTKYGNFNQSVLFTNLAYDIALTIRTAQSYGLSVKASSGGTVDAFNSAYGVNFTSVGATTNSCGGTQSNSTQFIMFADLVSGVSVDKICDASDLKVSLYALKRGAVISGVCVGIGCTPGVGKLDITFKRPNPSAIICLNAGSGGCAHTFAKIEIMATDGNKRVIEVRGNGQISVPD